MRSDRFRAERVALGIGALALVLLVAALIFEYGFGYRPCELCMLQRYLHLAAAVIGLVGGAALTPRLLPAGAGMAVALLAVLLLGLSGAVGVYQAGAEWHFWAGPAACTGHAFVYTGGALDLAANEGPRCDVAQWRLFGVSMAGYNALICLPAAVVGAWVLLRARQGRFARRFA